MTTPEEVDATTLEVARLIGASYRQLDWWARNGRLLLPDPTPGSGGHRRWTVEAVQHASVMAQLVNELGTPPALASRLAATAIPRGIGLWWVLDTPTITMSGRNLWVPEPEPDEDEEVEP